MPVFHATALPVPAARKFAIAALMGATMIAGSMALARAEPANSVFRLAQVTPAAPSATAPKMPAAAAEMKADTVEQRIAELHASLKITADQEKKWAAVATDMRENAAAMEKLVAAEKATPAATKTAVYDLKMYQKFSQAHVDGLKNLLSSFEGLYASMPDAQKKTADEVFHSQARETAASHG